MLHSCSNAFRSPVPEFQCIFGAAESRSPTVPLLEEPILNLSEVHRVRSILRRPHHGIDPGADGMARLRMSSCCRILLFNVILNRIK